MAYGYSWRSQMCSERGKKDGLSSEEPRRFLDHRTTAITKRAFYNLLKEGGVETQKLTEYFRTETSSRSDIDQSFVCDVADKLKQSVTLMGKIKREASISFNVRDFHERKWDIHHGNVYREFATIVTSAFEDNVFNFGRFISFFGISVSFAVYVFDKGMEDAVISVHAWTDQAIENTLGPCFVDGWEAFSEYADRLLVRLRKDLHALSEQQVSGAERSVVVPLAAAGIIGAAMLAAFAMKNAFS